MSESKTSISREHSEAVIEAKRRNEPKPGRLPRCCATCDYLTDEGVCEEYSEAPPLDFIEKENDCEHYAELIPF